MHRGSVFVLILESVARWSCELLSNLPLLKGRQGVGEVSQDSRRDGRKGQSFKHHEMYAAFGGMFYLSIRAPQQSVMLDN